MYHIRQRFILCAAAIFGIGLAAASAQEPSPSMEVLISIADQKLAVLRDGGLIQKYPVSTSRFGVGDANRSYKTPLGQLRVCDKVGGDLMPGAVIKHRSATGEVLDVNAPGRDPIVTRILWLEGLEEQNKNARERGIYIHGTPEEKKLGEPVSWGCIRMRSRDVVDLFDEIPLGTSVRIIAERLPRLRKYEPPKQVYIAARQPAPTPAPVAAATQPAASRIATAKTIVLKPAPALVQTADPYYVPSGLLTAKTLPEIGQGSRRSAALSSSSGDAGAFAAMKGSILFAGLPDGRASKTVSTPEPKKLLRASPSTVAGPPGGLFPSSDTPGHLALRNPSPTPGETKPANSQ